ncbi:MAG: hypothetical protein KDA85_22880, partial [Planctomycetaceae bacterium]|nr:hypothetical protein [Planctomycetaceae bacterium]
MLSSQWISRCPSTVAAIVTVLIGTAALAQPNNTRISSSGPDFDNLNRILMDRDSVAPPAGLGGNGFLGQRSDVDLSKVDVNKLKNLMKEAVDESSRLFNLLETDSRRNLQLTPLVTDLLRLRAQAARLYEAVNSRSDLNYIVTDFRQLDSDWRLLSHRISQTPQLSRGTLDSVERIDRIDREVGTLFKIDPTLDSRELLHQTAMLASALRNLADDIQLDPNVGNRMNNLVMETRKLEQQVRRVERLILDQASYDYIVSEYNRFSSMWGTLLPQLRQS